MGTGPLMLRKQTLCNKRLRIAFDCGSVMCNQTLRKGGDHGTRNDRAGDPHRGLTRGGLRRREQSRTSEGVVARRGRVPGRGGRATAGSASGRPRTASPGSSSPSSTRCRRGTSPSGGPTQEGEAAAPGNSFLVVFELEPAGTGTLLRMTESGFRERGWDEAKIAAQYADHVTGWDHFLPRLAPYAEKVGARADEHRGGRRPLVGGRRPDPAPDARPAAQRGQRDGHQPERAASR